VIDWTLTFNGLTIGAGTPYDIIAADGFLTLPDVASQDLPAIQQDGEVPGVDFLNGRTVTLTVSMAEDTWQADAGAFADAFSSTHAELPMVFRFPGVAGGGDTTIMCRVRQRSIPLDRTYAVGMAQAVIQLRATSPLFLTSLVQGSTRQVGFSGTSLLDFPVTLPLTFGDGLSPGGTIYVPNNGNRASRPVFTFYGDVGGIINPRVEDVNSGDFLAFSTLVPYGQTLTIDTAARTAQLTNYDNPVGASRSYGIMQGSTFPNVPPGGATYRFSSDSAPTSGVMSVASSDAWS